MCKLNPSKYIRALLDRFPLARTTQDFKVLLLWSIYMEYASLSKAAETATEATTRTGKTTCSADYSLLKA